MKTILLICIIAYFAVLGYFFLVWRSILQEIEYSEQLRQRLIEMRTDEIRERNDDLEELINDINHGKG